MKTIQPTELHGKYSQGESPCLIDVRTPSEYQSLHATYAQNIPLNRLSSDVVKSNPSPLYIICQSGGRSASACQKLIDAGVTEVVNVAGGTLAWDRANLPVVRGKSSISIQRQVLMTAGSLILIGVIAGYTFHPGAYLLSGFVGGGLLYAGVTGTCAMATLLAFMPWNNRRDRCDL